MPHVLWTLSGPNRVSPTEFEDHEKALAAAIAIKGLVVLEPRQRRQVIVLNRWSRSESARHAYARCNTANWSPTSSIIIDYMGEPTKNKRISVGLIVLLYLGVLFVFAYWMKREYWKDVH